MNIYRLLGVITGMIIGIVVCLVAFRLMNKDKKLRTNYDERQKAIRGEGYKVGFYTTGVSLLILMILESAEIVLPIENMVVYFACFAMGATALCCYSIWKGAYFGINNKRKQWMAFISIAAVINIIVSVNGVVDGDMIVDGKLSFLAINATSAVMFLAALVSLGLRSLIDSKGDDADEES